MSTSEIRGGDSNRYPAIVTEGGRLKGEQKSSVQTERFQVNLNSQDATTPVVVKAKTADKKMYLTSVMCSASGTMFVRLEDDDGSIVFPNTYLAANGGFVAPNTDEEPLVVNTNKDLKIVAGASGGVSINVVGYLDE